jgi:hypothetical protein
LRGRTLVECKSQATPVGVEVVRQLAGVVVRERAEEAIIASLGGFTKQAELECAWITIAAGENVQSGQWKRGLTIRTWGLSNIVVLDMVSHGYSWARKNKPV